MKEQTMLLDGQTVTFTGTLLGKLTRWKSTELWVRTEGDYLVRTWNTGEWEINGLYTLSEVWEKFPSLAEVSEIASPPDALSVEEFLERKGEKR